MAKTVFAELRTHLTAACAVVVLAYAPAALAQTWAAATLPLDGNIAGTASQRIGWGYKIENLDTQKWLVLTGLAADAFQQSTVETLFDLPVLAPGTSASKSFSGGTDGLFALRWNVAATTGFVNTGNFELAAEWWNGDPLAGGQFVANAATVLLRYSAVVTAVPEASAASMLMLGIAAVALWKRSRPTCA
jgi:hypothetical protein